MITVAYKETSAHEIGLIRLIQLNTRSSDK